jgi:hypothetical protein
MDDWKVGDLALCIKQGQWQRITTGIRHNKGPRCGEVCTVTGVFVKDGYIALALAEWPRASGYGYGYIACRFRKVTPPEADEFDREVIDLMTKQPAEVR